MKSKYVLWTYLYELSKAFVCVCVFVVLSLGSCPAVQSQRLSSSVGRHLHVSSQDSSFLFTALLTDIIVTIWGNLTVPFISFWSGKNLSHRNRHIFVYNNRRVKDEIRLGYCVLKSKNNISERLLLHEQHNCFTKTLSSLFRSFLPCVFVFVALTFMLCVFYFSLQFLFHI